MLIALMSVFSPLYTQPHCPIITLPPLPLTVSAFSQPVCRIGICRRNVCVHAWAGMCVQFYCLVVCRCALIQPHAICILLCVCCVLVSVLTAWHETHAEMKGRQLKIVVSRTDSHHCKSTRICWWDGSPGFFSWIPSCYNFISFQLNIINEIILTATSNPFSVSFTPKTASFNKTFIVSLKAALIHHFTLIKWWTLTESAVTWN